MNDVLPEARSLSDVKDWSFRALAVLIRCSVQTQWADHYRNLVSRGAVIISILHMGIEVQSKDVFECSRWKIWSLGFFSEGLKFCTTLHIPSSVTLTSLTSSCTEINNPELPASPFGVSTECYNSNAPPIINHRRRNKLAFSLGGKSLLFLNNRMILMHLLTNQK